MNQDFLLKMKTQRKKLPAAVSQPHGQLARQALSTFSLLARIKTVGQNLLAHTETYFLSCKEKLHRKGAQKPN